jgi:hypothetical protein
MVMDLLNLWTSRFSQQRERNSPIAERDDDSDPEGSLESGPLEPAARDAAPLDRTGSSPSEADAGQASDREGSTAVEGTAVSNSANPWPTAVLNAQSPSDSFDFSFNESFEGVGNLNALRDTNGGGWMGAQLVRGQLSLSNQRAVDGSTSLYMEADSNIGKAHLFKGDVWQGVGDYLQASAYFWFPRGVDLSDVYIMDWESKSAWSSQNSLPNTQPGIRVALYGRDGAIAVERGKMGVALERDFHSINATMPREEWVKVEWRLKLGLGDEGATQVFVNDRKVIDAKGTTYLDPAVAARGGVRLNDDYAFDRFKVGLTANSSDQRFGMYMDDIDVMTWENGNMPAWATEGAMA